MATAIASRKAGLEKPPTLTNKSADAASGPVLRRPMDDFYSAVNGSREHFEDLAADLPRFIDETYNAS